MTTGIEPVFASGGRTWPLAGMPDRFEPDDPTPDIPAAAMREGPRDIREQHIGTPRDDSFTHTASEPLAPRSAADAGAKWSLPVVVSCIFHAAIAGFLFYAVDEAVLMEGADFSGVAYLGSGADQIKAGDVTRDVDDAVNVTMVTMLQAKPVETVEARSVPVNEAAQPAAVAQAYTDTSERLLPVSETPLPQVTETVSEPVQTPRMETASSQPQNSFTPETVQAEAVQDRPMRTATETLPEVLATGRVEVTQNDNVVQKPAAVRSTQVLDAVEEVSAESAQRARSHNSETVRSAAVAVTDTSETESHTPKAVLVETAEVTKAEAEPVDPLPKIASKAQSTPSPKETKKPVEKAQEKLPAKKAEQKRKVPAGKTRQKAKAEARQAGNGGQNQGNSTRGQADGQEKGDSKQASRGGSKNGKVGNAALSNYPGKVRSKLVRAARSVKANGKGKVVVAFAVSSNGSVRSARVTSSSGVASVDHAALQAIRKAAPFPPIPANAGRSSWDFAVPLAFKR